MLYALIELFLIKLFLIELLLIKLLFRKAKGSLFLQKQALLLLLGSEILSVLCKVGRNLATEARGLSYLKHIDFNALG